MRVLTQLKGAAVLLIVAGLLVTFSGRWGALNSQEGEKRDAVQRSSKTFDDRRKHTIKLIVRYRPARNLVIVWGIGDQGGTDTRSPSDRSVWGKSSDAWDGTPVNVEASNVDKSGYLYCAIEQDDVIVREYPEPGNRTDYNGSCDLVFVAGGR